MHTIVELLGLKNPQVRGASELMPLIGSVLPITGNAYQGFEIIQPDGERISLIHYRYRTVEP